ncbi:hypothetical protein ONZ45_g12017 [Pleurotus djamor]|nr:hypothetical protein ONZ45_g12017 [Pleurotus djamor]
MLFTLDGIPSLNFTRPPLPAKPGLVTIVYSQEGLSPGEHTVTIQNGRETGGPFNATAIFLDAIIFTTTNELQSFPNASTSMGANNPASTDQNAATASAKATVSAYAIGIILVSIVAKHA